MKNLKLLSLLGIAMFSLLSFTYFKEVYQIKDGTYKAFVSKKSNIDEGGFSGYGNYEQDVIVKIENNLVKEISPIKFNKKSDKLINLALEIDSKGNAVVETSDFEQDMYNNNDKGWLYTYKLKIKKAELTK
jgi:hypothetical protein